MTTRAPFFAKRLAVALPTPDPAPVMRATLPSRTLPPLSALVVDCNANSVMIDRRLFYLNGGDDSQIEEQERHLPWEAGHPPRLLPSRPMISSSGPLSELRIASALLCEADRVCLNEIERAERHGGRWLAATTPPPERKGGIREHQGVQEAGAPHGLFRGPCCGPLLREPGPDSPGMSFS